jgi:hypothetical protein
MTLLASAWLCRDITCWGKDLGELPGVAETTARAVSLDLG